MIKKIVKSVQKWIQYRRTVIELSQLSENELNDIGISRYDIRFVARDAVRRS